MSKITLEELFKTVDLKIKSEEAGSYSSLIASQGLEKVARKVGEEAVEVVIAAFMHEKVKSEKTRQDLIGEVCDLFYHNLILLSQQEISFDEILEELTKRNAQKNS